MAGHLLGGGGRILQHLEKYDCQVLFDIFLGAFFANRIYLELGLSVVLQVLAVSKDLTSLDKGDRFPETFLLANLGVLHPRLKHLQAEISWT